MALKEFHLPDIGEGIAEGEIVKWLVKEGEQCKEEQPFVEVMTDKATVTITVPHDCVIKELRVKEGDVVPVESVIAVLDIGATAAGGGGGAAAPGKPAQAAPAPHGQTPIPRPAAVPQKPGPAPAPTPAAKPAPAPAARPAPAPAAKPAPARTPAPAPVAVAARPKAPEFTQASPGKVLAAPATRRRAREMGVDLGAVAPTGPRGRVTNEDLNTFLAGGAPAAPAEEHAEHPAPAEAEAQEQTADAPRTAAPKAPSKPVPAAPQGRTAQPAPRAPRAREERIPFRGLRKKIAEAMTRSKHTAAHFTYVDDLDVTELVELRKKAKELYAKDGINITYLPFIMKAVVEAMRAFPTMNSSLDEQSQELVVKGYYNFGVATDTDNGLIVPVVKDVDQKSIAQLAQEIQQLAEKTRTGKVAVEDLRDGTFTITNAGNIGGLFATPVINFPEVSILGVHAIKKTPRVRDDKVVVADVMYLSVSIDHRLVDGATGARWMNVVKENLERPTKLLLGSL